MSQITVCLGQEIDESLLMVESRKKYDRNIFSDKVYSEIKNVILRDCKKITESCSINASIGYYNIPKGENIKFSSQKLIKNIIYNSDYCGKIHVNSEKHLSNIKFTLSLINDNGPRNIPETELHINKSSDLLKNYCEQEGVPVVRREIFVEAAQILAKDCKSKKPTLAQSIVKQSDVPGLWVEKIGKKKPELPPIPSDKWRDRKEGELAWQWIMRVWGDWYEAGELTKNIIRNNVGAAILVALKNEIDSSDSDIRPPEDFKLPTLKEKNDAIAKRVKETGEMPTDFRDHSRVRAIVSRR